jgi:hypothetical protein
MRLPEVTVLSLPPTTSEMVPSKTKNIHRGRDADAAAALRRLSITGSFRTERNVLQP